MISQETIEKIRTEVSLIEIVQDLVQLKRRGSNWVGLCPFHSENSPSFSVQEENNFYHCFGCGESGNAISFIMKTQGLSFPEAVETLAQRFSIPVRYEGKGKQTAEIDTSKELFRLNFETQRFFQDNLKKAPALVSDYLKTRGILPEAVEYFGLGYALDDWRALLQYLKAKGFSEKVIEKSGLCRRNSRGELYDLFRNRLIFPVFVSKKNIAGFGARALPSTDSESGPKYLNSPESVVYQKNKILFGLAPNLAHIRQEKETLLVEGYLDVIGLWQVGVKHAVATCGTASSLEHLKRISRSARRLIVLFDGDKAGRAAAAKVFPHSLNIDLDTFAVFLPEGEDPDTLATKHGEGTLEYIRSLPKHSLLSCYIMHLLQQRGVGAVSELGAATKASLASELAAVIRQVESSIARSELIKEASFELIVDQSELQALVKDSSGKSKIEIIEEPEPENLISDVPPIGQLSEVDRTILRCVMVEREELPLQILKDPQMSSCLSPWSLAFVQGVSEIVSSGESEDLKKTAFRNLLRSFGSSWIEHWKSSHQMAQHPETDLTKTFKECCRSLVRQQLIQQRGQLEQELKTIQAEDERLYLSQKRIELERRIRATSNS